MISSKKMLFTNQENHKMHTLISCLMLVVGLIITTTTSGTYASYLTINSAAMQAAAEQHQQQQQQLQQQQLQQQPPSIIPFSFNSNVQENQRAIVMCTTSSGENPVSFTWLKDGQLLSATQAQARRITIKPDTDSSTLKISSVRLDHAGNYTCLAKNRFGSQMHSAQLVVHGEPRWLKEPHHEPLVATRGQTVVIDCQTTGWPKPEQTWKFKTHSQGDFQNVTYGMLGGGRIQLAANGSLIIRQADKSDEANYLCISSNGIGRGLSWSTSLKVTVPAHFETSGRQQPQTNVIRKQSQVQLRCDAFGDQPITIEWYKNKQPLAASASSAAAAALHHHNGDLNMLADARYSIHSNNNPLKNGLISQLLIRQTQRSDNSIYECVTRNQYGRDRQAIELVVQEEPDYIQELQVTAVNSRSVTLMWTEPYDGRSPITSYMFQYKRVQDAYVASSPSGLLAGDLESFGALDGETQQAAAAAAATNGQQHLLGRLAQASPLEGDWQHANRIVLPVSPAAANTSGAERSITIEKLEPSSKYILRALALNAIGQSKFSPPMEFSTDEEAPEVGPVNIRAVAINSTSVAVSWDEIPRSKHLGRIHGYYIGYRAAINNTAATNFIYKPYIINDLVAATPPLVLASNGGGGDSNSVINQQQVIAGSQAAAAAVAAPRLETVIQDLRRDTVYEITVVAFNSRGSGPSSDFVVCKTIEMEAPKPVKLAIRRESNESIFVEWQRDPSDQNPVDDYVLYQEKNSASQEWLQVRLPGNQTHYKAPGLKCGTRYQFYIIAHNKVGKSQPSEVVSASTSGAIPVVPSKQSLIKWINSTCLLVNLNSFQDNGCRIKTFTVRYRVERQQQVAASSVENGATASSGMATSTTSGSSNQQQQQQQQAVAAAQINQGSQLIGANGMSASHQALTVAGQLGGKAVLAGQTSNSAMPYTSEWIAIRPKSNLKQQRASEEDRMEYLCDLSPVGEYTIHVAAANDVGRSEIEYTVLMSSDELRHSVLKDLMEFAAGLSTVFAYIPSLLVFLLAALLLVIVCLILYTTAIKYYQKFVIMQNQMRATRRAKADEKRRRKLNNMTHGARNPTAAAAAGGHDKLADSWADQFEDGGDIMGADGDEHDQDDVEIIGGAGGAISRHNCSISQDSILDVDGDDEDETTATEELASSSGSSGNGRVRGRRAAKRHASTVSHAHFRHNHLQRRHMQPAHQYHQKQHSNPLIQAAQLAKRQQQHDHGHYHTHAQQQQSLYGATRNHQYLSNIANSAFGAGDTSSIDTSTCNAGKGKFNGNGSICMSTASNDSIHGRFHGLNSKQYVKMNEYTLLPSISASLAQQQQPSDLYGTAPGPAIGHAHHQIYRPLTGSSPSGQSSASNTTTTANTSQSGAPVNVSGQPTTNYSTLRRTNMQTYLPRQQQQQQQQPAGQQLARRPSQNVNDIYGYYMAPPAQAQAAAAAAAAQQAANEAANSIFVPPQQIIYSAPNIRRQPPVFL